MIEKEFEYKGYNCIITFDALGIRCGYVALTPKHKYFETPYWEIPVSCHGGLTWGEHHIPDRMEDKSIYYIGFDCGHCFDKPDFNLALKCFPASAKFIKGRQEFYSKLRRNFKGTIKDQEYVEQELKCLVDQLRKRRNKK